MALRATLWAYKGKTSAPALTATVAPNISSVYAFGEMVS